MTKPNKIAGAKARKWRSHVAGFSPRGSKQVRTLKFPLDLKSCSDIDFDKFSSLYEVTEGTGKGSLAGLIFAVHLSGFQLFGKAKDAELFVNSKFIPSDGFKTGWLEQTEEDPAGLTPAAIISVLQSAPRATRGAVTYESKPIADFMYRLMTGKAMDKADASETIAGSALLFFEKQLKESIPNRVEVPNNLELALKIFDASMASEGIDLPQIEPVLGKLKALAPPNTSIAFDSNLSTFPLARPYCYTNRKCIELAIWAGP